MSRTPLTAAIAVLSCVPALSWAHGANPRVTSIVFPAPLGGEPLLLTDTQGVFGFFGAEPRWLCEDAFASNAGVLGVAATSAPGTWLVASTQGVHLSADDACTFARSPGLPDDVAPAALSPHPGRPDDFVILAASTAGGVHFGVYRTRDAGRTFDAPTLSADLPWRSLLRDPEAPDRLYLSGDAGAYRSDDGGDSWAPLTVTVSGEDVAGALLEFLAVRPGADEVWGVVQRVPASLLVRSADHGGTWEAVTSITDLVDRLVFDGTGEKALVTTLFGDLLRHEAADGPWSPEHAPVPGFGCLTRGPAGAGDDTLYACADPSQTAPWVLARSDDFGRTWQPALSALTAVTQRWACGAQTPAIAACAGLCPGRAPGATCGSPDSGSAPGDAGLPDGGSEGERPADAAGSAGDARASADAAATETDARVVEPAQDGGGGGGCGAVPGRAVGGPALLAMTLTSLIRRRGTKRRPPGEHTTAGGCGGASLRACRRGPRR